MLKPNTTLVLTVRTRYTKPPVLTVKTRYTEPSVPTVKTRYTKPSVLTVKTRYTEVFHSCDVTTYILGESMTAFTEKVSCVKRLLGLQKHSATGPPSINVNCLSSSC